MKSLGEMEKIASVPPACASLPVGAQGRGLWLPLSQRVKTPRAFALQHALARANFSQRAAFAPWSRSVALEAAEGEVRRRSISPGYGLLYLAAGSTDKAP